MPLLSRLPGLLQRWIAIVMIASILSVISGSRGRADDEGKSNPIDDWTPQPFPVTKPVGPFEVTATGWIWETEKAPRLQFTLTRNGMPAAPTTVEEYSTKTTNRAGAVAGMESVETLKLDDPAWRLAMDFCVQPIGWEAESTFAKFLVPATGKSTVLKVPPRLQERGMMFAAVVGRGGHAFRNGRPAHPDAVSRNLKTRVWQRDDSGWFGSLSVERPTLVWAGIVPKEKSRRPPLSFRGISGGKVLVLYPPTVQPSCVINFDDFPASGDLVYHEVPLGDVPVGQRMAVEGFDMEWHKVEFTLTPPRAQSEDEKAVFIEEFKVPPEVFRNKREGFEPSADQHHASLFLNSERWPGGAMYSPASSTLVLRMTKARRERWLAWFKDQTGFDLSD